MNYLLKSKLVSIVAALFCSQLINIQMLHARPIQINKLSCIVSGRDGDWHYNRAGEIVLRREIYSSLFEIRSDKQAACKLPSAQEAHLDLELAIPSDGRADIRIDFYLNGSLVKSLKVERGKVVSAKIPLTGRSDISYTVGGRRTLGIETTCLSSDCYDNRMNVLKGNLEIRQPPGQ